MAGLQALLVVRCRNPMASRNLTDLVGQGKNRKLCKGGVLENRDYLPLRQRFANGYHLLSTVLFGDDWMVDDFFSFFLHHF